MMRRDVTFADECIQSCSHVPVKFPGWSQPSVPGLQARVVTVKKARAIALERYMFVFVDCKKMGLA